MRVYNEGNDVSLPDLDLLSLLFDSPHSYALDDTPLHAEAAHPKDSIITKAHARRLTKQIAFFLRTHYHIGLSYQAVVTTPLAGGSGATSTNPGASSRKGHNDRDIVVAVSTGQSSLPCLFYGVIAAEGIYSSASPSATVGDLARQIRDGPAKVIVCSKDREDLAVKAAEETGLGKRNVLVLESWPNVKLRSADGSVQCDFKNELGWRKITEPEELEESAVCILYSSGTTGLPKGVLISHRNMVSQAMIPAIVERPIYAHWARQGKPFQHRSLAHLPTAHIAGAQGYFINPFLHAGLVYWMPTFDFPSFLKYNSSLAITFCFSVPPIYMGIARHPAVADHLKNIRVAITGAAPLSGELQDEAAKKLAVDGRLTQTWGLSETTGSATATSSGREKFTIGSLGSLLPNVRLRLVDDEEQDVAEGEPGEAWLKGPIVTKGYHNNPEANKASFSCDGWFKTGDILRMEGDELFVVDRKKELIKYNGLQVAPAELEGVLLSHPSVQDAGVIGIQQNDTEVPRAYITLVPKAQTTEAELMEFVKQNVSSYKQLRGGVCFIDMVPRTPSGKVLRQQLRVLYKKESGAKL